MNEQFEIPKEYLDRAEQLTPLPTLPTVEELNQAGEPVVITLDAQDIGALTMARVTPYEFAQNLLIRFKEAGAPIEGTFHFKALHGAVFKMKDDLLKKPGIFTYIWLPQPYVDALNISKDGGLA